MTGIWKFVTVAATVVVNGIVTFKLMEKRRKDGEEAQRRFIERCAAWDGIYDAVRHHWLTPEERQLNEDGQMKYWAEIDNKSE